MKAEAPAYRADIDGLRAIAVLLVLVFHFDLVPGNKAGFIGVDVFFVISGFLITSIVRRQMAQDTFDLRAFYVGRIRRLAPALVATLVGVMLAGALLLFPDDFIELAKQVLASQFYVANIYYWRNVNYFGLGTDNVYLLHTWSLAVEEQFYLFYPLAMMAVLQLAKKYFWHALVLALALSFALNLALVGSKPEATFYLLPTRAWELLVGALVSGIAARGPRPRWVDESLGVLGLAAIAIGVAVFEPGFRFPGYFAIWPVAGAALLLLSGAGRVTVVARGLGLAPVTYIGKISYPLYLVHWPVHVFAVRVLGEQYGWAWRFAMFMLSIVLAAVVHHVVENPIRYRRRFVIDRRLMRAYAAGLATTVALFAVVSASGGVPQRFPSEVNRLAAFVNDKSPPLAECDFTGKQRLGPTSFCRIGQTGKPPTWLVYGDSHAWAAHAAFDRWLSAKGEAGLFIFRHACPPVAGLHAFGDRGVCFEFNRAILAFLGANAEVTNVALVSTWLQAPQGLLTADPAVRLGAAESIALFDDKLGATLTELHRLHKQVYVWEPVPGARRSVPLALARAALDKRPADIEPTRAEYQAQTAFFFEALDKHRALIAGTFSPADALCGSGRCAATIAGNPAYFDNGHITASTADFWVEVLRRGEAHEPRDASSAAR